MITNIKACFFDLDDTLIAAGQCHHQANIETFLKYGLDYNSITDKLKGWDRLGLRIKDIYKVVYKESGLTAATVTLDELLAQREEIFLKLVVEKAKPLPGAVSAVKLARAKGCIVAITSSGTREYVNLAIHKFGLDNDVDFTICAEEVTKGKPDPEIYNDAFQMADKYRKLAKKDCLVIEDSLNGVDSAHAAGIPVCFVPFFPYKGEPVVDYKLKSLLEFPEIFSES